MSSHKILVIDDSKVIRMHVKDMLPAGNFDVLEAKDGVEGYNLIRSEQPNLIMLDFLLPKMSGWEVYQEIQKEYHFKSIPLVMMSGRKEEVVEKIPEPFEYFAFIEKPFDQKQLVEAIKEAMTKAKKHTKPYEMAAYSTSESDYGDSSSELQILRTKVTQLETEMTQMKKQMSQLIAFIKKKLM